MYNTLYTLEASRREWLATAMMMPKAASEVKPVAASGLVNHGNVVCSSLVMLHIATIHKVQLSVVD